jgi:hypothetical protein
VPSDEADECCRDPERRAAVAAEIADVGITLLMLCDRIGLDPVDAMHDKLAKNAKKYPPDRARGRAEAPERGTS